MFVSSTLLEQTKKVVFPSRDQSVKGISLRLLYQHLQWALCLQVFPPPAKKPSQQLVTDAFAGVLKCKSPGNNYEGHSNTARGPEEGQGQTLPAGARGQGCPVLPSLGVRAGPPAPHPRSVDTDPAILLQLTLQMEVTMMRVHSYDRLVNSGLEIWKYHGAQSRNASESSIPE